MTKKELMEMTKLFVNELTEEDMAPKSSNKSSKGVKEDNFQTFTVWFMNKFNSEPTYDDYRRIKKELSK